MALALLRQGCAELSIRDATTAHSTPVANGRTSLREDRRVGRHYALQSPRTAIDGSEVAVALIALAVLTEVFRDTPEGDGAEVAAFLEVAGATLRAEVERPSNLQ